MFVYVIVIALPRKGFNIICYTPHVIPLVVYNDNCPGKTHATYVVLTDVLHGNVIN